MLIIIIVIRANNKRLLTLSMIVINLNFLYITSNTVTN